jgi:hypothetical protein
MRMTSSEYSQRYLAFGTDYLLNEASCLSKLSSSLLRNIELSQRIKSKSSTGNSEYRVAYITHENDAYTKVYAKASSPPLGRQDHLYIDTRFPISSITEYSFRFNPKRVTTSAETVLYNKKKLEKKKKNLRQALLIDNFGGQM